MASTECTAVSNNGISMPSVFFGGFWLAAGCCCRTYSSPWSCEWVSVWCVCVDVLTGRRVRTSCDRVWRIQDSMEFKEILSCSFFFFFFNTAVWRLLAHSFGWGTYFPSLVQSQGFSVAAGKWACWRLNKVKKQKMFSSDHQNNCWQTRIS